MNKYKFQEIQTERLLLTHLNDADWATISYLRSDKEINQFVKRPNADTKEKALEFIAKIKSGIEQHSLYYWKITQNKFPEMIGSICLWNFSEDQKTAEIGYDLSLKYQQQGFMNESLQGVINFGFHTLNLNLIEAYTHKDNLGSRKLLERNGFVYIEGKKDTDNEDTVVYELKNR